MPDHTDIDYEALGDVIRKVRSSQAIGPWADPSYQDFLPDQARAVVAAYQKQLREQGVVEVRADDLDRTIDWYALKTSPYTQDDRDTYDRIRAALAASGDGVEK